MTGRTERLQIPRIIGAAKLLRSNVINLDGVSNQAMLKAQPAHMLITLKNAKPELPPLRPVAPGMP